ncbi:MAG: transcription elongation factor GreA [Spirochaetales bacterium]|nr:transcription elongation factor GreA [Spirochaetales bacterium]
MNEAVKTNETLNPRVQELVHRIREMLNEEKWTRATLNSYTIKNFEDLDEVIKEILEANAQEEIQSVCEEHLHHTKNSIIALYLYGILSLSQQFVDDSRLVILTNIFIDNHKWNIVEHLCQRILDFGENKFALRTLVDCYNNENMPEKLHAIWERLIRIDYEEADIVKSLAELKEKEGNLPEAIDYYKKALHRYINKKLFNNIREIWQKLISLCPDESDFFYHAEKKVAKTLSEERAIQLLEDLYPYYKKKKDWDTAIELLKRILTYDAKNTWARKEIVECYRQKYSYHSQLEEYIRISNLTQSWRNVHDAISDFEKHISFDAGNFVYHRQWGVGQIKSIKDDMIEIDFVKKRNHKMSLKMAVSALQTLSKQHIWVLKTAMNREKLKKKIKEDIPWALKTIIKSLDNAADMKRIKAELVPSILTNSEWTQWSAAARRILKEDNQFGSLPDKADFYEVRDYPVSIEEKMLNKFKAEKDFFARVQIIEEYVFELKSTEPGTDSFAEMFEYFLGFLRSYTTVNEYVISSAILVKKIITKYPFLSPGFPIDLKELFSSMEDVVGVFSKIPHSDIKREFFVQIKKNLKNWHEIYISLFSLYPSRSILDELINAGYRDSVKKVFQQILNEYKDNREAFVWLVRNYLNPEWLHTLQVPYEKILISLIHLSEITYREIENKKDTAVNRKLNRQILSYLIDEKNVEKFLLQADEESIHRVYTLIWDAHSIEDGIKIDLRSAIQKRFPHFKFVGDGEKEVVASRGFYTTPSSYEAKQQQLQHLVEVEVPNNSREIAEARALGDLRENAEYKAAKEKQELLNTTIGKLREEIERAQVIFPKDVDTSKINFGTKAILKNLLTDQREEFVILGPWESDPSKSIISYLSPLGGELLKGKKGDTLSFEINERKYQFYVEDVVLADF